MHAFDVECEFNENQGFTVLKPEQWTKGGFTFPPTEDQRCSEPNCFTQNFEYSASDLQIEVKSHVVKMYWLHELVFRQWQIYQQPAVSRSSIFAQ